MSEILYVVIPPTRIPYFLAMKEAAVSVHSGFFHILCFFWGCKFKGEAHAVRQRPAKPGEAHPPGSAQPARQCPRHTDEVC